MSSLESTAVAATFDLGRPLGPLRPVAGGHSHRMWRLDTVRGSFAVKEMNRVDRPEWLPWLRAAWQLEQAAWRAGVRMPEPVGPPDGDVVATVPVAEGELATVRVHRWVAATTVQSPLDPRTAGWAGQTLATLHSLAMAPQPRWVFPVPSAHEAENWPELVRTAKAAGADWADGLAELSWVVTEIGELVRAQAQRQRPEVLTHCDLRAKNILLAQGGPVLVDWDVACARVPREELAGCALSLAGWNRGSGPQWHVVRSVVGGYLAGDGVLDSPLDATDAATDLGIEVDWLATVARRALGDGAQGPDDVERCAGLLPILITTLPHKLSAALELSTLTACAR